jgi:hypothetical protein
MDLACSHPDPALCRQLGWHVHGRLWAIWSGTADDLSPAQCEAYRRIWRQEAPGPVNLAGPRGTFERVYLVNLARRCDRLNAVVAALARARWPFQWPQVLAATDGEKVPCPPGFKQGGGAWGCLQSHRRIVEAALMEGCEPVLVLEDDCTFDKDFRAKVLDFLARVPGDWEGLFLGGQHHKDAVPVGPGIVRCVDTQRTHCYAARGEWLRELYRLWYAPTMAVHCDWVSGPACSRFRVYAPSPFLVGQAAGRSDINGRVNPTKFWKAPTGQEPVVLLRADREVVSQLRQRGWHSGFQREGHSDFDTGLVQVVRGRKQLREWVNELQWECVSETGWVLCVWHPAITAEQLRDAWPGPVYEIRADSAAAAVATLERLQEGARSASA